MTLPLETNSAMASAAGRYRALSPLAIASLAVGVLSILSAFHWLLGLVPLAGLVLGWRALEQIRRAPGEWAGVQMAWWGIGLSLGLWLIGTCLLLFGPYSRIPYGYDLVSYEDLQPDPKAPAEPISQKALNMQDKKVFVEGYMQPRRTQTGIREFILCPFNGECPYCIPNPKRTERIRVVLQGDLEAVYTTHLIGVGGRFQVDPNDPRGIPYTVEADYLR